MGLCNMCIDGTPLLCLPQDHTITPTLTQELLLLPIRRRMSQEAREVLNILIYSGYDLADFVFCEHSGIIMSTIATVECDDFVFGK